MSDTAIVVLHYNKIRLTRECIQSILAAGYPAEQIHCFDNGSQPEVFREINQAFPQCCHQRTEINRGYSGGFNAALKWVFARSFSSALFCTNDTHIFPGALEACCETARETGAGMVAPCILYLSTNKDIDSIGGWFDAHTGTLQHYHQHHLPTILDPGKDYIPGTALWIDRDFFNQLGGVDETYHMYWEDVDLSFRAHAARKILARSYNARISHGVGQTCRKKPLYTTFYFLRNRIRFCQRHVAAENRNQVIALLEKEIRELGRQWELKDDQLRLTYFRQLLQELQPV